ncbi:methyltransferase-like protein 4 [Plakobranchus ocellatus]|uniref:Methyltransferase-like protein 4 n=1 Tax=Plakobranchus ocellatus TaxID=259542 RepID=A0AAV3ZTW2_9GAST|nr:methyltransferase-like protein 4 [Plakobranchus ocellatus]
MSNHIALHLFHLSYQYNAANADYRTAAHPEAFAGFGTGSPLRCGPVVVSQEGFCLFSDLTKPKCFDLAASQSKTKIASKNRTMNTTNTSTIRTVCWCNDVNGAFLAHNQEFLKVFYDHEANKNLRWKSNLFAIHSPFMMDSQAERIQREKEEHLVGGIRETSAQKKRKKKSCQVKPLSEMELKVINSLPFIVERAKNIKMLPDSQSVNPDNTSNNKSARVAADIPGCGDLFEMLTQDQTEDFLEHCTQLSLHEGNLQIHRASDVVGRPVGNSTDIDLISEIEGHKFIIPAQSCFLTSNFQHFVSNGFRHLIGNKRNVLQQYLPLKPRCLELFARNLTKGWTSWGNEPLRHQHIDHFEVSST